MQIIVDAKVAKRISVTGIVVALKKEDFWLRSKLYGMEQNSEFSASSPNRENKQTLFSILKYQKYQSLVPQPMG